MKALRFTDKLRLEEVPVPSKGGEALVRVLLSGICNTDLEIVRGYAGFQGTIGHEFVGVVEKSGNKELVGKRVVGEINVGCGECQLCRAGDARHCATRTVLGIHGRDGAHAEFLTLPERNLLEVPNGVADEEAVFVEPLAAAFGIFDQVAVTPETAIAVIGDGKLGILCARSAALLSKRVTIIGKHPAKLEIAQSNKIRTLLLKDVGKEHHKAFDVVIEASGSESGFAAAVDLVRPRGKIVLKSTFQGRPTWEASRIVVDEITVVGSRCGRFSPVLDLLASKRIEVADLISEKYSLSNGIRAFERAAENGVLKVILGN